MKLMDGYLTFNADGEQIDAVEFEAQEYKSVGDAYRACIMHAIDCIESDNYEIIDTDKDTIWYRNEDDEFSMKVRLYHEDGTIEKYVKERKYLVIDEGEHDTVVSVFDTLEEANHEAEMLWEHLTDREQKSTHVYVLDVTEDDLADRFEWDSFTSGGYCKGRFDSEYWYAVMRDYDDDWGTGSYYLDTAIEMAKEDGAEMVAVISIGSDPICIDEIRDFDAVAH